MAYSRNLKKKREVLKGHTNIGLKSIWAAIHLKGRKAGSFENQSCLCLCHEILHVCPSDIYSFFPFFFLWSFYGFFHHPLFSKMAAPTPVLIWPSSPNTCIYMTFQVHNQLCSGILSQIFWRKTTTVPIICAMEAGCADCYLLKKVMDDHAQEYAGSFA